ncbi:MAG: asparaginase, partial [Halocynthiibacter sp.]
MTTAVTLAEVWRGQILESVHQGHAVVCRASGEIVSAWGDPDRVIYPRSSCKMLQALALIESGAASAAGLKSEHLALACASHVGAAMHTGRVSDWLDTLGLAEPDLRCGPQTPADTEARNGLVRAYMEPCQLHNNCSGKHAGFLTLSQYLGAGPEYVDLDHPVQKSVKQIIEEVTGQASPGHGIDGCSAPNFATTVHGLARAMAFFAAAPQAGDSRSRAAEHCKARPPSNL